MPRGLDHVVHAVRDLDTAGDFYRRLGFTVGARNRHPWGTHNHIVQFPGFFIELLTVAEPEKIGSDGFSLLFARFNQSFLTHREGLSLLILESHDARADALEFAAAGIAASEAMSFEREGRRPDGTVAKVGFSLAFARDGKAPEAGFATCQQRFPENFWSAEFQRHSNTATGIAGAVLVAQNPADHRVFLAAFTGVQDLRVATESVAASTPRGEVEILSPSAFRRRFGTEPPDCTSGARLAALRFAVRDPAALRSALSKSGIEFTSDHGRSVIAPAAAMGATLAFE